jgi:F-type H+-transporting ATPase subunit b
MEIISSLGVHWTSLLAQFINFGILFFVLTKLVYKPMMKALNDREQVIKQIGENSQKTESLLQDAEEKQEAVLAEARKHADKIIKEAESASKTLRENLLSEAKKDAEKLMKEGARKLAEDQDKFYANLKKELVELISLGVEKTVGKYITPEAQSKLKEEALSSALSLKDTLKK